MSPTGWHLCPGQPVYSRVIAAFQGGVFGCQIITRIHEFISNVLCSCLTSYTPMPCQMTQLPLNVGVACCKPILTPMAACWSTMLHWRTTSPQSSHGRCSSRLFKRAVSRMSMSCNAEAVHNVEQLRTLTPKFWSLTYLLGSLCRSSSHECAYGEWRDTFMGKQSVHQLRFQHFHLGYVMIRGNSNKAIIDLE